MRAAIALGALPQCAGEGKFAMAGAPSPAREARALPRSTRRSAHTLASRQTNPGCEDYESGDCAGV